MTLDTKLTQAAEKGYNVLFIGSHGVGKTTIVMELAKKMGLKVKYFSASTLDPFTDIIGIPAPDKETNTLKFYQPLDLKEADLVFFDELNRSHPKVQNAVLELIQFKSINGNKFPKLKCVWAAMNPPGDKYMVEDLDPALVDRFHLYVKMTPAVQPQYLKNFVDEKVAHALCSWWNEDCGQPQRALLSPRRMEYLARLINDDMDYRDALPPSKNPYPMKELQQRLDVASGQVRTSLEITRDTILNTPDQVVTAIQNNKSIALAVHKIAIKLRPSEIVMARKVIEALPVDLLKGLADKRYDTARQHILDEFRAQKIDVQKDFPLIWKSFEFDKLPTK